MPTHAEAFRLNLEFYRKQAKTLLHAAKSGDKEAIRRITRQSPKFREAVSASPGEFSPALHDAQLTIAREQGFAGWARFKSFIDQSRLDFQSHVQAFVKAALSDRRQAGELLTRYPVVAEGGLYPALVLGDARRVAEIVEEIPESANEKGGPEAVVPLVYVCFSRFAWRGSDRAEGLVETARMLLRRGADPNATCIADGWPNSPLSCLYGATGLNNNPALARVLLEAGANPNDGESLYHSTEHPDLECVRLLLKHGAAIAPANALKHMLDREDVAGLRLLLSAGADPNEVNERGETALHWAVWRGRSVETITILVDHGAAIDAKRKDGRTAYALAAQSGQTEIATLLAERGADTELSTLDRFLKEAVTASPEELHRLLLSAPKLGVSKEVERLLPDFVSRHRTAAVRVLLSAGSPVNARGELGATALHWACWKGYADLVKLLLDHGASLTEEDEQFQGTPAGWFGHGAKNCPEGGGDYVEVARLLIAAGATIAASDMPTGRPEVDAVPREHKLIE
jgi:ankyrin repeat protein